MKKLVALTVAVSAFTGVASAAIPADGTFRGRTSQHFRMRVVVRDAHVQLVAIPWKATRCRPRSGYSIKFPKFGYSNDPGGPIEQAADGRSFTDGGRVVDGPPNNRAVVRGHLAGRFVGEDKVRGTMRIRVRTNDKYGRHRCVARVRWSAKR